MILVLFLFLILNTLDFYTTYTGLTSKTAIEANPIVAAAIKKIGLMPTLIIYKGIGFAVGIVAYMSGFNLLLILGTIGYGFIVANNYYIIKNKI